MVDECLKTHMACEGEGHEIHTFIQREIQALYQHLTGKTGAKLNPKLGEKISVLFIHTGEMRTLQQSSLP